jgi:hypothetical protein
MVTVRFGPLRRPVEGAVTAEAVVHAQNDGRMVIGEARLKNPVGRSRLPTTQQVNRPACLSRLTCCFAPISVSSVLNLPLPVLDGGQPDVLSWEGDRAQCERSLMELQRGGLSLALMSVALFNDVARLAG